ncbi:MAG: deoxyribodipyrimidine photolyase, partial [bacterium]
RIKVRWKARAGSALRVPLVEVDAHNIVPCWTASGKGEYAAYTFRPRILSRLERFLVPFPRLRAHPFPWPGKVPGVDWGGVLRGLKIDRGVGEVRWIRPGERAARRALKRFLQGGLDLYAERRNDPSGGGQSDLSPYLHFGQLSAQRVALEVRNSGGDPHSVSAFLEELIVRRELADNFCFYNQAYDSVEAFPDWARKTLHEARRDPRPYLYRFADLEGARTHDPLWNAAQRQMVVAGKMHGYMRMYWAKKILEWTPSPEEALETAIALNDRYELDGRDPNGYAGVAWSIGGVHDRAWGRRPVFGKIRYMSDRGIQSKFDVGSYLEAWGPSPGREE